MGFITSELIFIAICYVLLVVLNLMSEKYKRNNFIEYSQVIVLIIMGLVFFSLMCSQQAAVLKYIKFGFITFSVLLIIFIVLSIVYIIQRKRENKKK